MTAAVREVREETGLIVEIESVLHVESSFLAPGYHFLGVYLLVKVTGGVLSAGDELLEAGWYPASGQLPEMAFQADRDRIEVYATGKIAGLPVV